VQAGFARTLAEQHSTHEVARKNTQIQLAEALADLLGPRGYTVGSGIVARGEMPANFR
jgi:hypothetical protein